MTDQRPTRIVAPRNIMWDLIWVVYNALMFVAVLVALTERTRESILVACVLCYLRGRERP